MADTAETGIRARRIDVGAVAPARRVAAWAEAIHDSYYPLDLVSPGGEFVRGRLTILDLPGARFGSVHCDPMLVDRRRRHLAQGGGDFYFLPIPLHAPLGLRQGHRLADLRPRDFAVIATADAYRYMQHRTDRLVTLRLEGNAARDRLPMIDDLTALPMRSEAPLARIFVDFVTSILRQGARLDDGAAAALVPQLLDMLALTLTAPAAALESGETAVRLTHLRRLYRLIDARLDAFDLGPDMLATELGLSRRYVQKIFADRGETVSAAIRARRLAVAQDRLADPARAGQTVAVIGYSVGFADPAHFSRAFRQATGMTPRDFRARHRRPGR